jgi:hypothetical protein
MQSPNEPRANEELHREESRRGESGASSSPGAQRNRRRAAQPWRFSFILFLLGFVLLVVLGKLNLSRLTADLLRIVATGLCIAAFVIARRAQRAAR